jgi:holo-[acyl-carrier protein] synthase
MNIIGLGVDLADVGRVRGLLARYGDSFRRRCFTDHEWEYAHRFSDPAGRLAARFAGKEAVMKSLGTGWRRLRWTDIEITGGGRPHAVLSGRAAVRAEMLSVREVLVTVTHTRDQAIVMAIAVGEEALRASG